MVAYKNLKRVAAEKAKLIAYRSDGVYAFSEVLIDLGDGHAATGYGFCKLRPGDEWKDGVAMAKSKGRAIGDAIKELRCQMEQNESL